MGGLGVGGSRKWNEMNLLWIVGILKKEEHMKKTEGATCPQPIVWSGGGSGDWWKTTPAEGHIQSSAILGCYCHRGRDK